MVMFYILSDDAVSNYFQIQYRYAQTKSSTLLKKRMCF